jgi:hypothetical protein
MQNSRRPGVDLPCQFRVTRYHQRAQEENEVGEYAITEYGTCERDESQVPEHLAGPGSEEPLCGGGVDVLEAILCDGHPGAGGCGGE